MLAESEKQQIFFKIMTKEGMLNTKEIKKVCYIEHILFINVTQNINKLWYF